MELGEALMNARGHNYTRQTVGMEMKIELGSYKDKKPRPMWDWDYRGDHMGALTDSSGGKASWRQYMALDTGVER
jgi:hypothetical protein